MDIFDQTFGPPNGGFDERWVVFHGSELSSNNNSKYYISSLRRCGLCSLWFMAYIDYTVSECCPVQCPDWLLPGRDLQIESLKQDLELLRAELERIKAEVRNVRHFVCFRREKVWYYFSSFCEGSAIRHATEVPNQQFRGRIRRTACTKATCTFGEWTAAYGARLYASE